jgi:AraC family transcriptional regulator
MNYYERIDRSVSFIESHPADTFSIEAAVKYGCTSADAFTRAFREEFVINPSDLRSNADALFLKGLRRISIMDEYFELNDRDIVKDYPDIKLLKKLPDMNVACFKYFGPEPENLAFAEMKKWVQQNVY